MRVNLIVAYARNGVIGRGNTIPWRIAGEQAHFKQVTMGHPIVMGRKTWESLPRRPLPGRRNIVVTRNAGFVLEGADLAPNLAAAIAMCAGEQDVFVIGGAQIYAAALPIAERVLATEIDACVEGDVFFPALDPADWRQTARVPGPTDAGQLPHAFVAYERR